MDWPRSTWHFRHRYVSDAWSDQVMVSTITCTQWLVQMKGADCRAYQKAQQQMCTTHPPDQKLKIIQTEYMWYPYDCLVHYIVSSMPFFTSFVAWRSILFNPYITLPALQEIHHTARLLINKVPPSLTRLLWQKSQNDFHWKVTEISSVFFMCALALELHITWKSAFCASFCCNRQTDQ